MNVANRLNVDDTLTEKKKKVEEEEASCTSAALSNGAEGRKESSTTRCAGRRFVYGRRQKQQQRCLEAQMGGWVVGWVAAVSPQNLSYNTHTHSTQYTSHFVVVHASRGVKERPAPSYVRLTVGIGRRHFTLNSQQQQQQ